MSELCKECGRYQDEPNYSCDCELREKITELKQRIKELEGALDEYIRISCKECESVNVQENECKECEMYLLKKALQEKE